MLQFQVYNATIIHCGRRLDHRSLLLYVPFMPVFGTLSLILLPLFNADLNYW